jgi:hypothetical protein
MDSGSLLKTYLQLPSHGDASEIRIHIYTKLCQTRRILHCLDLCKFNNKNRRGRGKEGNNKNKDKDVSSAIRSSEEIRYTRYCTKEDVILNMRVLNCEDEAV